MIKKLPWPSLAILLIAYTSFAPFLPPPTLPSSASLKDQGFWILATLLALSFSALVTAPLRTVKENIIKSFQSDLGLFLCIVTLSFFSVIILARMHIFYRGFILICATALARLDLQTLGFTERQAFLILSTTSSLGLLLGWVMVHLS